MNNQTVVPETRVPVMLILFHTVDLINETQLLVLLLAPITVIKSK